MDVQSDRLVMLLKFPLGWRTLVTLFHIFFGWNCFNLIIQPGVYVNWIHHLLSKYNLNPVEIYFCNSLITKIIVSSNQL